MKRGLIKVLVILLIGSSCSYPVRTVTNSDSRPAIAIVGASGSDVLILDGKVMGSADDFNGEPNTLEVSSGTHVLQVKGKMGQMIHEEKFFIDSNLRTIHVGGKP